MHRRFFPQRRPLLVATALSLLGLTSALAAPRLPVADSVPESLQMTNRVIVKYKNAVPTALPSAAMLDGARIAGRRQGVELSHLRRTSLGADVLQLSKRLPLAQVRILAESLQAGDALVEYAEPDRILTAQMTPTDVYYPQQWHYFDAIGGVNLPTAWDKSTGAGVVVAVLDTGIRPHADLAANVLSGYDFIGDTLVSNDGTGRDTDASDPGDAVTAGQCYSGSPASNSTWHGTHVAGTIAAVTNNGNGVAGVAPGAKILPVRVLGRCGGYTSDIADGIVWSAGGAVSGVPSNATPARVINMSMGGAGACDTTTQNAIAAARSRGAVVVVSAGNESSDASLFSPSSCAGVIAVAATGKSGAKASYSNYGSVVSIAAPGGDGSDGILSTWNTGLSAPGSDTYAGAMGTSMAAPHVSGVVALMLARNSSLTPDKVLTALQSTARPFPAACTQCGAGMVDASAAVDLAVATIPSVRTVAEVEPNNSTKTAQSVSAPPVWINGSISSVLDTDYFKVTLAAGAQLTSKLTPNSASNYDLYVYNAGGKRLAYSANGTGLVDTVVVRNTGTSVMTVNVRVLYVSGATGSSNGSYSLSLGE
ncbi:MAG TPA: S8 family peptidase [Aquabacterium sp.]|uniref:S8 family peptidase n=1 Tax=Aquabacterium sp. TaxID=1872578 RepID=UPI002E2EB1D3|nr:S8 family peptidase [Aquabacterium sp.]HEX5372634.1 S8 family peptidase [Aquabacterium sp.]